MKYRTLGKTGLKVSEVGFGAWAIGGNNHGNSYGPTDDKVSIHDPQEGLLSLKYGQPAAIQVVFNLLRQEAKNQLFQAARVQNVAIIAREPLSNGFLSGKFTIDSTFPSGDIRSNFPRNYLVGLIRAAQQLRLLESKTITLAQA